MKNLKQRFVSPVLMWAINIIGIVVAFSVFSNERIIPKNAFGPILFILAFFYFLYLAVPSMKVHKEVAKSAAKITKLLTKDVYSVVRHPIYSGDIILVWGIFFLWSTYQVLASAIWLTIVISFWASLEEKVLVKKFPREYPKYKKKVPKFIPKFSRFE
jgi:protein-S-isoprenylcysteine O-methyltransferase Ste14